MTLFVTPLLRNLVLPFGDILFGQRMMARLKFLEKAQWWDRERIAAYQRKQLNRLVEVSYSQVPFYRDLYNSSNITSEGIVFPEDLHRLPIVTKDMLRKGYPDRTIRPTGQKTYEASTSGSTGKNFYVKEDAYTAGWYRATFLLELEWSGWSIGESHLQTGMTLERSLDRKLKDKLLNCHYASAYELDDNHLDLILLEMERHKIKYLWGYPGSLYHIAKRAKKNGWNQTLRSAVTWGDMLFPHYRKEIEETFQTTVFDTYGCGEGFHIAAQCEYGSYHLQALDVIVEFVNDEGLSVKPGEEGNLLITRLHPGPMPLIRYFVGDRGIPFENETCPCGRSFPLLKSIVGRTADVVLTPSGNRLIVHFFTGVLEHFPIIDTFQIVQEKMDFIRLRIVPTSPLSEEMKNTIINSLKSKGCSDLDIEIEIVEKINLPPSGKHRFVISHIN